MDANSITGCLLGTAVGDALGLPYEGMSPTRARRLFEDMSRYHFLFSRGMVSDDTEHTCMVAQSLISSGSNPSLYAKDLSWRFRMWFLGLPAGIGFATLRAILKLFLGISPEKSGVYSAGNGPAMRSAIIGVCFGKDEEKLKALVWQSTIITHADPKAYHGAISVALAAHMSATEDSIDSRLFLNRLEGLLWNQDAEELMRLIRAAAASAKLNQTTIEFVKSQGLEKGVSGYIFHTVPAVMHAWFVNPTDFRKALLDIISCGGDTDTAGAILGGIVGAGVGKEGIPEKWLSGLVEWPRTVIWMESLAQHLYQSLTGVSVSKTPHLPVLGVAIRNTLFMLIVLFHGFRRLMPPY